MMIIMTQPPLRPPTKEERICVQLLSLFATVYVILLLFLHTSLHHDTALEYSRPNIRVAGNVGIEADQIWSKSIHEFHQVQKRYMLDEIGQKELLLRQRMDQNRNHNINNNNQKVPIFVQNIDDSMERPGFMVLGMHRSGTSMLGGLLVKGLGYNVGPEHLLIQPAFDNEKGFYERVDAVLQNDEFMRLQRIDYANNVISYDYQKALEMMKTGEVTFSQGKRSLSFYNDPNSKPWIQKDPRMCITLRTWLPLLEGTPAIVFSYRHPLEVAKSMEKRDGRDAFPMTRGLRLWIVYNMRAVQNSADLCRVISSNDALMSNAKEEIVRIGEGLTKCGLPPPHAPDQAVIDDFVDPNLHLDPTKHFNMNEILDRHGDCIVYGYNSYLDEGSRQKTYEVNLYKTAMKIFCDLKSRKAFEVDYKWPEIPRQ